MNVLLPAAAVLWGAASLAIALHTASTASMTMTSDLHEWVYVHSSGQQNGPHLYRSAVTCSGPDLLRWMLQQSVGFKKMVHGECSDARLLLLVHGHGWQVSAELAKQLDTVEKRRLAWYWAVEA